MPEEDNTNREAQAAIAIADGLGNGISCGAFTGACLSIIYHRSFCCLDNVCFGCLDGAVGELILKTLCHISRCNNVYNEVLDRHCGPVSAGGNVTSMQVPNQLKMTSDDTGARSSREKNPNCVQTYFRSSVNRSNISAACRIMPAVEVGSLFWRFLTSHVFTRALDPIEIAGAGGAVTAARLCCLCTVHAARQGYKYYKQKHAANIAASSRIQEPATPAADSAGGTYARMD